CPEKPTATTWEQSLSPALTYIFISPNSMYQRKAHNILLLFDILMKRKIKILYFIKNKQNIAAV
ncbi:MAG: hypothetical protein Q8930_16610, partial [Bacillota bacterium]|nr:hypothetical protein [Bacillota bacterium]